MALLLRAVPSDQLVVFAFLCRPIVKWREGGPDEDSCACYVCVSRLASCSVPLRNSLLRVHFTLGYCFVVCSSCTRLPSDCAFRSLSTVALWVFRGMFVLQSFELCVCSWAFDPKEAVNNTTLHVFKRAKKGGYPFTVHNSNDFRKNRNSCAWLMSPLH